MVEYIHTLIKLAIQQQKAMLLSQTKTVDACNETCSANLASRPTYDDVV